MEYVADLETVDALFVNGLRVAEKGIVIERTRLEIFLDDAFHNYRSLLEVHQNLLENMQNRQLEQHPRFGMVSDLLLDAALNWQDAYMEYVTHYPIAKAKVQEEELKNPKFAAFLKVSMAQLPLLISRNASETHPPIVKTSTISSTVPFLVYCDTTSSSLISSNRSKRAEYRIRIPISKLSRRSWTSLRILPRQRKRA